MNMVPLASIPLEVRKDYALALVDMDILDGWEALRVTVAPGDVLVPEIDFPKRDERRVTHWQATCEDCGKTCWTRGGTPRCMTCHNRAMGELRRKEGGYCARGHVWSAENIYTRPNGERYCRICSREDKRNYRERKKVAA